MTHNTREGIEERVNTAILNLIFSGISIAQMEKIPDWLLESIEKNKTNFQEAIHQELQKAREEQGKRYITLMNQALGETELPEDVWKKIAKVNQLILDK
jgi:hypothetical protein